LIVYTAGTRGADVEIPGLAADDAERLREDLARVEELDERT
jgi:membrane protein YdbS with pleckstrin-like domain